MLRHLFGASATAETMLDAIARDARETGARTGRPVFGDAVLDAMRTVPREAFVPKAEAAFAYENRPLPIGHGQTISQPFIVALMTELLDVEPGARILEIGTGCGYQTAILCALGARVCSVEVVEPLATAAAARLAKHLPGLCTAGHGAERATVTEAGRRRPPSTASSSPRRRPRCRPRSWISSSPAVAW